MSAKAAVQDLKAALLKAEFADEAVDGGLLGMAAAQAGRLGEKDLTNALCAYAWPRLSACGGREVAELATAAVKCGVDNNGRFFSFVGAYCFQCAHSFSSLRDIALVSSALIRKQDDKQVDLAAAFMGLLMGTQTNLNQPGVTVRDMAEFYYSLGNTLEALPFSGGPALYETVIAKEVISELSAAVRTRLHKASTQDLAKVAGGVGSAWSLMPQLQATALKPLLSELSQAVRFRYDVLNSQDLAQIAAAFAKVDLPAASPEVSVLVEEVCSHMPKFTPKDLCQVLWACTRSNFMGEHCTTAVIEEVAKRDLSSFSVQDLCMASQCLAKMGPQSKAALCLLSAQVFSRQASGFSAIDKVLFLWALAKSKVVHLALCRMLVRELAVEDMSSLPRDKASIALWSLAVLWPSLPQQEAWPGILASSLLYKQPWVQGQDYEVTNCTWALGRLPEDLVRGSWQPLLQAIRWLSTSKLSGHELCNSLSGLLKCPREEPLLPGITATFAAELNLRCESGAHLSWHDRTWLANMLLEESVIDRVEVLGLGALKAHLEGLGIFEAAEVRKETRGRKEKATSSQDKRVADESVEEEEQPRPPHNVEFEKMEEQEEQEEQDEDDEEGPAPVSTIWRCHARSNTCTQPCCPEVPDLSGISDLRGLRLNSHCDFKGHCVQVKHTFIHVECNEDSEDDCMICNMQRRPRARSADYKQKQMQDGAASAESAGSEHLQAAVQID
eukprot:TRINITY_DN14491_c0_g1_i1.p1 TRINITY_DN14491_c0_g1~~TRINITY_DN14491_c0_g1_i1.p1  ORF type:complete len:839 (-),score=203.80 TRINITY_DN14491_c0_g1_i1:32-2212(-)